MMMFDVAVIGGGLAGCHAAIHLAHKGHRVVLLEAGGYPRVKVCGEFLSPECVALAEESGFLRALHALRPIAIHTLRIVASQGQAWHATLDSPAWGISRFALDKALVDYALAEGVTVITHCAVRQIQGNLQQGFTLIKASTSQDTLPISARAVIVAYGRHGKLDSPQMRNDEQKNVSTERTSGYIGLKQHFTGPSMGDHLDLHIFQGGYFGMSQVEDGSTNICLLVQQPLFQRIAKQGKGGISQFIAWLRQQNKALDQWLAQAKPIYPEWLSVANVSLASKPTVHQDVLYAGDAAGMIAPLAGDGMAMALHSGRLAARVTHQYLEHTLTSRDMCHAYTHEWRRTFATRLNLGRLLQSIMLNPRLLAPALTLINQVPSLGNWLIQHTRDLNLLKTMP